MYRSLLALLLFVSTSINAEPLYWQAEKGAVTYLILGSVHVGDDTMFPLPSTINDRLQTSDGLIIEADVRKTQGVVYPEITIQSKDVLSKEQQTRLKQIASQLSMNPEQLLNTAPWAAAIGIQMKQIESFGYRTDDGVDLRLIYKATTKNVPVLSLESIQFQIDLLTGQAEGGKEFLLSVLDEFEDGEMATHCLINSWKAGDLNKLNEFATLTEMSPEFENAFIYQRNKDWVNKLAEPSWLPNPKGSYVMVVGTLHLVGEQNVLSLLKDKGFKVTQLSQSGSVDCQYQS